MLADREGVAWELHTSSFVLNFESLTQTVTNIAAIFMLQELYFTSTSESKMRSCELSFPLKMERYPATSGVILPWLNIDLSEILAPGRLLGSLGDTHPSKAIFVNTLFFSNNFYLQAQSRHSVQRIGDCLYSKTS